MTNSLAQEAKVTCTACGKPFDAGIWLIVDITQRPDLLERLRKGVIHRVKCPQCGHPGEVDAPLLIYRPGAAPAVVFSPAQGTTEEEGQEQAVGLLGVLRKTLAEAWRDEWVATGLTAVSRPQLGAMLGGTGGDAGASDGGGGRPESSASLQEELLSFVQARTWDESRRVLETHPGLLTEAAETLLDELIAIARGRGDSQAERIFAEHRTLLSRCRSLGVEAAFTEKKAAAGEGIPSALRATIEELSRPENTRNHSRRAELCRRALAHESLNPGSPLWAALQGELGNSLAQNPPGDRAENLEQAIAAYQQAMEVMTRQAMPVEWAQTMNNLATAYSNRIRGDRAENLEQAIAAYQQAMEVMTRQAMPVEWAQTMNNLATAYSNRIRGDRAENLEQAIAAYQQAMEVMTRQAMPVEWAQTMNNLATAYSNRIRGDRAENLEQAIAAYQQAIDLLVQRDGESVIGGYLPGQLFSPALLERSLLQVLPALGGRLMKPLATRLQELGASQVSLIPTGQLGLLPLHAGSYESGVRTVHFLDEFFVAFASSARSLKATATALPQRHTSRPSLTGVGNPLPHPKPLPFARAELEEVVALFGEGSRPLYETAATRQALLQGLPDATHLHLACHGSFDLDNPLDSHLELSGQERLSLAQVLDEIQPSLASVRLVCLSACQTAVAEFRALPDEVIGLPAGFSQAGVPGVVGTLWPVNDLSTALLMVRFYEYHLRGDPQGDDRPLPPGPALCLAQRWLRKVTAAELLKYFEYHQNLHRARRQAEAARLPEEVAAAGVIRFSLMDPDARPFSEHPYHWAPFIFVGV